jgi:hypothetical protein
MQVVFCDSSISTKTIFLFYFILLLFFFTCHLDRYRSMAVHTVQVGVVVVVVVVGGGGDAQAVKLSNQQYAGHTSQV